jgi:hypothetical protein
LPAQSAKFEYEEPKEDATPAKRRSRRRPKYMLEVCKVTEYRPPLVKF